VSDETRGTYYFIPKRPEPVELLANPPYAKGTEYEPACGTGAFLVKARQKVTGSALRDAGMDGCNGKGE
jgi:hypothetical protein